MSPPFSSPVSFRVQGRSYRRTLPPGKEEEKEEKEERHPAPLMRRRKAGL